MEDLAPYFQNLAVSKVYEKGKRGRKIAGYAFTWRKESKSKRDLRSNELLERSQEYYYIRTNTFLSPKAKFRAIDKFRGIKLGTTEKRISMPTHLRIFLIVKRTMQPGQCLFVVI